MTAKDKGPTHYVFSDGTSSIKVEHGRTPLIEFYRQDNDGASFLRRGAETELVIDFAPGVGVNDLEKIVQLGSIPHDVKAILRYMIKQGDIKSGSYLSTSSY